MAGSGSAGPVYVVAGMGGFAATPNVQRPQPAIFQVRSGPPQRRMLGCQSTSPMALMLLRATTIGWANVDR
eukprot:3189136-Rhodomonas_salina.1